MTTERKDDTFGHRMAMIFFRFWSKLIEMKLFFSFETAKPVLFAYAMKDS